MWGGLTEDKVVIPFRDEGATETLFLAFSDVLTLEQSRLFNRMTAQVRQTGETDLRRIFRQGIDSFNKEAERRGWTVQGEFWWRPLK